MPISGRSSSHHFHGTLYSVDMILDVILFGLGSFLYVSAAAKATVLLLPKSIAVLEPVVFSHTPGTEDGSYPQDLTVSVLHVYRFVMFFALECLSTSSY